MNDRGKRDIRDRRLLVQYLIFLVTVGVVGVVAIRVMIHRRRSEHLLEAARAAGYPTSYTELAEYTRLPEGVPNAADVYTRAFAAYVPLADDANLPLVGQAEQPDRGKPMPEPMAKAVSDLLTANQECLFLLHQAAGIEHCRYDWDYADQMGTFPHGALERRCAILLQLAAFFSAQEGDTDSAIGNIRDGLRLGDSLRRDPGGLSHAVRLGRYALALDSLERVLSMATLSDDQLIPLQEVLNLVADDLDFHRVMVTDRCFRIEYCRESNVVTFYGLLTDQALRDTLAFMGDCVEASRLSPPERLARIRAIVQRIRATPSWRRVMLLDIASHMNLITEVDLRTRARLDLAQSALAVERFRQASGESPGQLEELVPRYLDAVPLDPFDGQPLRYRRTDAGYRIYCIMEDGQDNGGLARGEVKRGDPYNLCFIVTR